MGSNYIYGHGRVGEDDRNLGGERKKEDKNKNKNNEVNKKFISFYLGVWKNLREEKNYKERMEKKIS